MLLAKWILPGFIALALGLFTARQVWWPRPTEPQFHGRQLSEWLADVSFSGEAQDLKAQRAVAAIGTNALPWLVSTVRANQPRWKWLGARLLYSRPFAAFRFPSPELKLNQAVCGIRVLGRSAKQTIPLLTMLLDEKETSWVAMTALLQMLPDSAEALAKGLTNKSDRVRFFCATGLADGATNASLAVPTLIKFLNDPRNRVRWTAAKALGAIGLQPHRSVPAFINALEDADWEVRYSSVTSLVVFRPEAKKAIPLLLKLKNEPVPKVQAAAAKALEEIDPTGVGSAGGIEPP